MFAEGVTRDSRESFAAHSLKNHFNEILRGIGKYDGTSIVLLFYKIFFWSSGDRFGPSVRKIYAYHSDVWRNVHIFLKIAQTLERYYRTIALHREIKDNANIQWKDCRNFFKCIFSERDDRFSLSPRRNSLYKLVLFLIIYDAIEGNNRKLSSKFPYNLIGNDVDEIRRKRAYLLLIHRHVICLCSSLQWIYWLLIDTDSYDQIIRLAESPSILRKVFNRSDPDLLRNVYLRLSFTYAQRDATDGV